MNSVEDAKREYCPNCDKPLLFPDKPCPYCSENKDSQVILYCQKCGTELKKGFLFSNIRQASELERIILELNNHDKYCENCYRSIKQQSQNKYKKLTAKFNDTIEKMPILTIENPANLNITKYCNVITSQIVVKTGDIGEYFKIKERLNSKFFNKIYESENTCLSTLKKNALKSGANLVLGCKIDYAQLNSSSQVFLISMQATGVVVEEFNIFTDYEQKVFNYILLNEETN